MHEHELTPVDRDGSPIPLTSEQLAKLDADWEKYFTPDCRRRDMILSPEMSPAQRAAFDALDARVAHELADKLRFQKIGRFEDEHGRPPDDAEMKQIRREALDEAAVPLPPARELHDNDPLL